MANPVPTTSKNPADASLNARTATDVQTAPAETPAGALARTTTHEIVQSSDLAPNPSTKAILALVDPDFPEGAIVLGKDPWTDYLKIDEGESFSLELVALVKRFETDDATGEIRPRYILVGRTTRKPQTCQRKFKEGESGEPRGELRKEKVDGRTMVYDEYKVPVGTLVATNLRTIMKPAVAFTRSVQARELFLKIGARLQSKRKTTQTYWDMKLSVLPLPFARDNSLDGLSKQANASEDLDADFESLGRTVPRPIKLPRDLNKEASLLLKQAEALALDTNISQKTRDKACVHIRTAANLLLTESCGEQGKR